MNRFPFYFVAFAVAGCRSSISSDKQHDSVSAPDQEINNVPVAALSSVPERLHLLSPGMTHAEVIKVLGLTGFRIVEVGSGPDFRYGRQELLRPDYELFLYFDETKTPPRFIEANLVGNGWQKL